MITKTDIDNHHSRPSAVYLPLLPNRQHNQRRVPLPPAPEDAEAAPSLPALQQAGLLALIIETVQRCAHHAVRQSGTTVPVRGHDPAGLHVLFAVMQHEDECVPDVTRTGVVSVAALRRLRHVKVDQLHGGHSDGAGLPFPVMKSAHVREA